MHTKRVELAQEVDLAELASRKPCFVGADLANVVNDATLHAAELGKPAIGMADFAGVIDRAMTGIEHRSRVMNEQEKRIIAHHESGHALVAQSRAHCDPVKEVSIIPRGVATLGYTQQVPTEDRYVLRRSAYRRSTMTRHRPARRTCGCWVTGVAANIRRMINDEVRALLADAHTRVASTLGKQHDSLEQIARCLLEQESRSITTRWRPRLRRRPMPMPIWRRGRRRRRVFRYSASCRSTGDAHGSVSAGDDPLIRRTPRLTQDAKLTRDDADSVNWQRGVTMATRIYRAANCILIFDIR